ncbi:MAG: hypothetical protein GY855_15110 [candidate division Zixibacteria bacterium]|nr:hypothetical protein [candidate division Zixibacteria bacterium]
MIKKIHILFIVIVVTALSFSCRPKPGQFPSDTFTEADTVYYCDMIIFIADDDDASEIVVCEFGREKSGEMHSGEFWGCIYTERRWTKFDKSGKYRLLSSNPSVVEGPPGVMIRNSGRQFKMEYSGSDFAYELETGNISTVYQPTNNDKLREYYGIGKGKLKINDRKIDGKAFYTFTRWVGYTPVTTKYRTRYKDFERFFLFGNNTVIIAKENNADLVTFSSTYGLTHVPLPITSHIKAGRFNKTFKAFKTIVTDRTYDLALFRIPYGWEIEFDHKHSVVLAGQGYYLDNKILTGRAIIEVTGALDSDGRDYELHGVCEFIK